MRMRSLRLEVPFRISQSPAAQKIVMAANDLVKSGKYRGHPYDTLKEDRKYVGWLLHHADNSALPRSLQKTKERLEKDVGGVLVCGQHKNCFFTEVVQKAPDYGVWAADLSDPGPMKDFAKWMKERGANQNPEDEDASKMDRKCVICVDRSREAVFIPCGHLVSCLPCASVLVQHGCPMCREDIATFLKVFT